MPTTPTRPRSLKRDLAKAFDLLPCDEETEFTDVTLIGTDGAKCKTSRLVLASRSDVFKRIFCEHAGANEITLPWHSEVLWAVIEYCFTDDVNRDSALPGMEHSEKFARLFAQTFHAAHHFELPGLQSWLNKYGRQLSLAMVFPLYDEIATAQNADKVFPAEFQTNNTELLEELVLKWTKNGKCPLADDDAFAGSIASLCSAALGIFLRDERIDEPAKFALLKHWCENQDTALYEYAKILGMDNVSTILRFL